MAKQKTIQEQISEMLTEEKSLRDIYETKKAEMLTAKNNWKIAQAQRENLQRDGNK